MDTFCIVKLTFIRFHSSLLLSFGFNCIVMFHRKKINRKEINCKLSFWGHCCFVVSLFRVPCTVYRVHCQWTGNYSSSKQNNVIGSYKLLKLSLNGSIFIVQCSTCIVQRSFKWKMFAKKKRKEELIREHRTALKFP